MTNSMSATSGIFLHSRHAEHAQCYSTGRFCNAGQGPLIFTDILSCCDKVWHHFKSNIYEPRQGEQRSSNHEQKYGSQFWTQLSLNIIIYIQTDFVCNWRNTSETGMFMRYNTDPQQNDSRASANTWQTRRQPLPLFCCIPGMHFRYSSVFKAWQIRRQPLPVFFCIPGMHFRYSSVFEACKTRPVLPRAHNQDLCESREGRSWAPHP